MDDGAVLEAILSLPSPPTPVDGGDVGILRTIGLVRAWASSRAALRAAIRRRRRIAAAIEASAAEGRAPTRRELVAWQEMDGAIQLGFASLLASTPTDSDQAGALLEAVSREHAALKRLDAAIGASADPDDARIAVLREIRAVHASERVLAFTELATTAEMYFRKLRGVASVGLLTARGAHIASGRLPRDALLERFAPCARGVRPPVERERVTLLIATDLLSEGVNLQDASVVVHLDLPWNPARLAQRVGRVRRPGGAAMVHSYLVAPPAGAAMLLDVERRLRQKLGAAARAVGRGIEVVPSLLSLASELPREEGRAALQGETLEGVGRWARPLRTRALRRSGGPIAAGVRCEKRGWLAALDDGRLVASLDGAYPNTSEAVARAVRSCEGPPRPLAAGEAVSVIAQCEQWIDGELVACQAGRVPVSRTLDRVLDRRIARAIERTPRHLRAEAAARASQLIATAGAPRPLGAERALQRLVDDSGLDAHGEWLAGAAELASTSSRGRARHEGAPRVVALIVLGLGPWEYRKPPPNAEKRLSSSD